MSAASCRTAPRRADGVALCAIRGGGQATSGDQSLGSSNSRPSASGLRPSPQPRNSSCSSSAMLAGDKPRYSERVSVSDPRSTTEHLREVGASDDCLRKSWPGREARTSPSGEVLKLVMRRVADAAVLVNNGRRFAADFPPPITRHVVEATFRQLASLRSHRRCNQVRP